MKQGCFFLDGEACREFLEGVPKHAVRAGSFVNGKIALEHASIRTESVDRVQVVVERRRHEFVRGGWCDERVPSEPIDGHVYSAELRDDVGASREIRDVIFPLTED